MTDPAGHLEGERRAVEVAIREAFRGVTREGGISWNESVVIDGDLSGRTREEARTLDIESRWQDLVDDKRWHHEPGVGGFNFLDPIGFRYYIAPAMIRCIREDGGEFSSYALNIDGDFKRELVSLLNARQADAVAQFIRLMIAIHTAKKDELYREPWSTAYKYWRRWDRGTTRH